MKELMELLKDEPIVVVALVFGVLVLLMGCGLLNKIVDAFSGCG